MELPEFDDIVEVTDGHNRRKTGLRRLTKLCTRLGGELRASLRGRRLFTLFALVNFVNYLDRGVVPGGSQEFNDFIRYNLRTLRPDVYLGILQSAFIFGFSVACLVFARLASRRSPFTLMGVGLGVWCAASVLAGSAKPLDSYTVLLLGRLLSGVGEASFVTVVPPLITETAPPGERGLWLALFYTAQPVGAGMGYVYGSVLATSKLGWQWAFYLEALAMAPLALACSLVPRSNASGAPNVSHYGARSCSAPASATLVTPTADKTTNRTNGADGTVGTKGSTSSAEGLPLEIERQLLSPGDSREDGEAIPSRGRSRRRRVDGANAIEDGRRYREGGDEKQEEGGRGLLEAGGRVHEEGQRVRRPASGFVSGGGTASKGSSSLLGVEITRLEEQHGEEEEDEGMDGDALGVFFMGRDNEFTDSDAAAVASTKAKDAAGWLALPSSPRVYNRGDAVTPSEGRWMTDGRGVLGSINSADPVIPIAPGLPQDDAPDRGRADGELLRDALEVVDRPVFCLVVLGAAATAAVTAGISTFGTGFVTSLELLSSETRAAATFGGMICAAGLLGTPAGGALIDAADPEGRLRDDRKLVVVLGQATLLMFASTVFIIMAMAQSSLLPFLIFFFLGATLLFATTSHASLAVMLAAPRHLRPLSLAINSVSMHALGDVPSPTVIGALKDALAPHCALSGGVGGSSGVDGAAAFGWAGFAFRKAFGRGGEGMAYGEVVGVADGISTGGSEAGAFRVVQEGGRDVLMGISEACRHERGGLRLTLFMVSSWLLWTCLFFCLARAVQDTASAHVVQPPTWSDLGDLISKGLFGRLCCTTAVRKKIPCRAWRWRKAGSGSTMPGRSMTDEVVSQLEQPLIDRDSSFEM